MHCVGITSDFVYMHNFVVVVVSARVQLIRVSDLAFFYVQQSKRVSGFAMGDPHTWFLDFVFVFQKLVIHGFRKQAILVIKTQPGLFT